MKRLLTLLSGTALAAALSFGAQAPAGNAPAQTSTSAPAAKKHVKKHSKKNVKSNTSTAPAATSNTPAKK
jgi:hypothetical protein